MYVSRARILRRFGFFRDSGYYRCPRWPHNLRNLSKLWTPVTGDRQREFEFELPVTRASVTTKDHVMPQKHDDLEVGYKVAIRYEPVPPRDCETRQTVPLLSQGLFSSTIE